MTTDKYILRGREVVPVDDLLEWANWYEENFLDRHVADDRQGDVRVSTVFLGLDHNWGSGPPLLFETMVFGGKFDGEMDRYATYDEAEIGHRRMCEHVGVTDVLEAEIIG